MLLEFRMENYKSFQSEAVFTLTPAPEQTGLSYSVLHTTGGEKHYRALCSAVIYGPNAAGKSNLIGGMDVLKSVMLRGHIRNEDSKMAANAAATALELIPNNLGDGQAPVMLGIKFATEGVVIEYGIRMDLGGFLERDHKRKILWEQLRVNEEAVFTREDALVVHNLNVIEPWLVNGFKQNELIMIAIAGANLNDEELFLMNGFKTMFSAKLVALISEWLSERFMVIYRADALHLIRKFSDPKKKSVYIEKTLNEAASIFGVQANELGYMIDGENGEAKLCSLMEDGEKKKVVAAEVFESYGTIRFVNLFPLVVSALMNGGTLVVDEFDASIHPMALMNIVNLFHNDEVNVHGAQLIFNTHNPVFLNSNLFRRDEIKFVERDAESHRSTTYALSDFGATEEGGVRENEDYMRNYFVDRYGAIQDVDFQPVIEGLLERESEGAKA